MGAAAVLPLPLPPALGAAKYSEKSAASIVALMSTSLSAGRLGSSERSTASKKSDSTPRSCTSSTKMCVTPRSVGSCGAHHEGSI